MLSPPDLLAVAPVSIFPRLVKFFDMPSRIDQLPIEVSTYIFSFLRHADLANLTLVCKSFTQLATPLLWTHIELHRPGWHERFQHEGTFHPTGNGRKDELRKYIELPDDISYCSTLHDYCPPTDKYRYYNMHDERFIRFLELFNKALSSINSAQLSSKVPFKHMKSLCLDINLDLLLERGGGLTLDFWTMFSVFQNLESFELIVSWLYNPEEWDRREQRFSELESTLPPLTKLCRLCLRSYIPKNFARWTMAFPEQLNTLELSILDRPIGNNLCSPRRNPPPEKGSDQILEDIEDDGGDIPWVTEESDSESDEDFDGEAVSPRALAITEGTNIPDKLGALSTLILVRPAQYLEDQYIRFGGGTCCSIRSETAILQEWTCLIRATRRTLQHLVIDQRPCCEDIETESAGQTEFLELHPFGPGFQRFKETVVPVLLEDAEWPALKSLRFYGFDVPEPLKTQPHPRIPRQFPSQEFKMMNSFLPAVKQRLEPLGVDIGSFLGRRMVFEDDDGVVLKGGGLGEQCDYDD